MSDASAAARRARTFPALAAVAVVSVVVAPVVVVVAALVDAVGRLLGRRLLSLRVLAFFAIYVAAEVVGLLRLLWVLRLPAAAQEAATRAVQTWWTLRLFRAVSWLFRLRFDVDGSVGGEGEGGPVLLLLRHASIIDTLLPTVLLQGPLQLRFVLKQELLNDPCLDVAGLRLRNHFVARGGKDTAADVDGVTALAADLGAGDGIVVYPEGTRATPQKQKRARERLLHSDVERAARLAGLQHVLPLKLAGVEAVLDVNANVDVVFVAHAGFDGAATVFDLWRGVLFDRTIRVKLWRVRRADIPDDPSARRVWLDAQWNHLDATVSRLLEQP